MTTSTWRCAECDTYNDTAVRRCMTCDAARGAARSPLSAARETTPAMPPVPESSLDRMLRDPSKEAYLRSIGVLPPKRRRPAVPPPSSDTPPPPPARRTAAARPGRERRSGCLGWLLLIALVAGAYAGAATLREQRGAGNDDPPAPEPTTTASACDWVALVTEPDSQATLVDQFRTPELRFTICRVATTGELAYDVEREEGGSLSGGPGLAAETSGGYVLGVGQPDRYEIDGDVVTVFEDDRRTGEQRVIPQEPSGPG